VIWGLSDYRAAAAGSVALRKAACGPDHRAYILIPFKVADRRKPAPCCASCRAVKKGRLGRMAAAALRAFQRARRFRRLPRVGSLLLSAVSNFGAVLNLFPGSAA
jgi:hypothetical protein